MLHKCDQSKFIALRAKSRYLPYCHRRDDRHMTKRFTSMNVRHVNLDNRYINRGYGVSQRIAIVRESAWIKDDAIHLMSSFMDRVDQHAFMIGLDKLDLDLHMLCLLPKPLFDIG